MKLKSISIVGFKTFADKVHVQFHDGITGIIGPNGSGKSNMIGAVRWILSGNSAKNLRDPTEIIFAGSQNRKPSSMAEVILTFTNDGAGCPPEFMHLPEVSIGRRLFRDGGREYFMNREPCRLKDILDFLLAIGLGSRGLSIIEQEKRDRIIQATPADLRTLLEETAGITIFRQHRAEAEKRIASTQEKLRSLADIEHELTQQSEHLNEQVQKVTRKRDVMRQLRESEIRLLCQRVGTFREIATRLRDEINHETQRGQEETIASSEWETRANELKAEQLDLRTHLRRLEEELEDKRITYTKYEERRNQSSQRASERSQRRKTLEEALTNERALLVDEEKRANDSMQELEKNEQNLKVFDGEIETLETSIEQVDENLQVERIRGEEIQSEIRAVEELISTLLVRNEILLERIEKANKTIQRIESQTHEEQAKLQQITADKGEIEVQLSGVSDSLARVTNEKSAIEAELGTLKEQITDKTERRDQAKEHLMNTSSMLTSLQKLDAANEGLSDGTRVLREDLRDNVTGFLFEKVSVHPEDEAVLEVAVPDLLEAALIDDQESLIDVLDRAEEVDISRVAFVVRDWLEPLTEDEDAASKRILAVQGLRSVGARSTSTDPRLTPLFARMFVGRDEWLVTKAIREAGPLAPSFIFITERGALIQAGRNISFGRRAEGDASGLLHRKRQIAELEAEKKEVQKELASAEGVLYEIDKRRREFESEIAKINEKLSEEKVETLKFTTALESLSLQERHLREAMTRVDTEVSGIRQDISRDRETYSHNQSQVDNCEEDLAGYKAQREDHESTMSDLRERRETVMTQIHTRRSDRAVIVERTENCRRRYDDLQINAARLRQNIDRSINELAVLESLISDSGDEDQALDRELIRLRAEILEVEASLEGCLAREAELEEELRMAESRLRDQKDAQAARQRKINEKGLELARIEAVLTTAEQEAEERFGLAQTDLPNKVEDPNPAIEKNLDRLIHKLREEVETLGPVNERAVEEYEAVEQRRQFLDTQKSDIETSLTELAKAIEQVEETTKIRFQEVYEAVNREFMVLFPTLFPGGEGHLNLVDPEDLLNTGVEVLVRLPGKRMQKMHLFSGGEKALTAISLIFALLKTHPAPFCLLDEVDAPLDEANVGRFTKVLGDLSEEFQFVVITHNRRTMEVLDQIYGITMQEPGVSKMVSVDLSEVPNHLRKPSAKPTQAPARAGATQMATQAIE